MSYDILVTNLIYSMNGGVNSVNGKNKRYRCLGLSLMSLGLF
jgi:hypothetical protein